MVVQGPWLAGIAMIAAVLPIFSQSSPIAGPVHIIPRPAKPPVELSEEPILRVDSSLVLIPVHVTNGMGATVPGLSKSDFRVLEDGVEQKVIDFSQEDAPLSIGVLFDVSGSMKNKTKISSEALASFFRTANAHDEFFLVEFNERARLVVPFTSRPAALADEVLRARPSGMTCLLDAMRLAMGAMKSARHPRRAILVISDGGDNWSRHNIREIGAALTEADVQVYAMGIFDADTAKHPVEERNGPKLLDELAADSGGRQVPVKQLSDLPSISASISKELREQYVLGYTPSNADRDGKYRRVQVKLSMKEPMQLHLDYRRGYYAPNR